jgi:uncharacterized membrane protein YhiD involved in acid resistance
MNKLQEVADRLTHSSQVVDATTVTVNLMIAAFLAYVLGRVYIRFGTSISNRRMFAANFVMLACTTALIITVVKSSLALSLGLVGALSIVRFRSAIKEPEELAYLFLTIAIGLGLGADQTHLTVLSVGLITALITVKGIRQKSRFHQNLFVNVASRGPNPLELSQIVDTLKANCGTVDLRRFDEREEGLEASFLVELDDVSRLEKIASELRRMGNSAQITFSDHRGVLA